MNPLLSTTRRREIAHIAQSALAGGVLTVSADSGEEAIAASTLALGRMPAAARIAAIDVARCDSTRAFALEFARAAAGLYMKDAAWLDFPTESRPEFAQEGLVELGDELGGGLVRALDRHDEVGDEEAREVFGVAIDAVTRLAARGEATVLALLSADELVPPARRSRRPLEDVDDLLWTLRSRLQHAIETPSLLLVGGDATEDLTADEDAAFFGWGTTVRLSAISTLEPELSTMLHNRDVGDETAALWAREIAQMVDGSVLHAERVAELTLLAHGGGMRAEMAAARAWTLLLEIMDGSFRETVRSLRAVDRLALPVALALAHHRAPYAVDKFSSGPNRALRSLRVAGFVVQRKPREWRLTDPLLAAWLREPRVRGRYAFGRPTIYVLRRDQGSFDVTDGPSVAHVRSTHDTLEGAEWFAHQLARDARGADIVVVDSDDPDDLPDWARPHPDPPM